jgi:hypothetical protein
MDRQGLALDLDEIDPGGAKRADSPSVMVPKGSNCLP